MNQHPAPQISNVAAFARRWSYVRPFHALASAATGSCLRKKVAQGGTFHALAGAATYLLFALGSPLFAKIPEPDAIYYGKARHNGGNLVAPTNTGDIIAIARLNGVIVAQTALSATSPDFVLKVPVDDGQEPRLTGTTRGGERVRIYLKSIPLNVEYEATQSLATNGLVVPTLRGDLTGTDLTVNGDLGGMAPGFADYSAWAADFGLGGVSGNTDTDHDGYTNLQEFMAGTDPTSGTDLFHILEIRRANGVSSIKFGPILLSREYSIWSSDHLYDDTGWQKIGTIVPNAPADYRWFDHLTPEGTPALFYRLSVDVQ